MKDISIQVVDSDVGNLALSQSGQVGGQCQLNNTMTAAAYASGQTTNTATSGKDKKGQKFGGKKGEKGQILTWVAIVIVVLIVLGIIARVYVQMRAKK